MSYNTQLIKNIIEPSSYCIIFNIIEKIYKQKLSRSQSRNLVCLTHAVCSVLLNFNYNSYLYKYSKNISTGYFIYDMIFALRYDKFNIMQIFYHYHHLTSIYIIHQNPKYYFGDKILFWAELSNIPSYFVYYYLHKQIVNKDDVKIWKNIQKYVYALIRIPVLGHFLYKSLKIAPDKKPTLITLPVYLLGIFWTFKLFKQTKK